MNGSAPSPAERRRARRRARSDQRSGRQLAARPDTVEAREHRRRRRQRRRRVRLFCCLSFAVGPALWFVDGVVYARAFAQRGERTTATVLEVQETPRRGPDRVSVEFRTADGREVVAEYRDYHRDVGDQVAVEYDRAHPDQARPAGSSNVLELMAWALLAGGFVVAGLVRKPDD